MLVLLVEVLVQELVYVRILDTIGLNGHHMLLVLRAQIPEAQPSRAASGWTQPHIVAIGIDVVSLLKYFVQRFVVLMAESLLLPHRITPPANHGLAALNAAVDHAWGKRPTRV